MTKRVPVFVTSVAGGEGDGSEGAGGEPASERRRRGRRKGSLVAMEGLLGSGARRLWAWGCRWASSRLIAPAAERRETTTVDEDPQIARRPPATEASLSLDRDGRWQMGPGTRSSRAAVGSQPGA